ncbi:MAG: hypothetical protein NTV92_08265, partial [Candidatus Bipolaricaulota bacterium]|nr:hypothetical protein [Candidatus Bipolaricaulota bacterium]
PSVVTPETQTAASTTQSQQPIAATSMQASTQHPNEALVIAPPMLTNEVAKALFVESVAGNSVTPFELKGVAETLPQEVGTVTPKVETVTPTLIPQAQPLVTVDDVPISEVNTDIGNSEIVAETTKVAQNVVADPLVAKEKSTAPVQQVQDTRQAVTGKVEPKQTASSDTVITEITTAQVENRPLIADNLSAREAVLGKAIEPRGNTPNNVTPSKTAVDAAQPEAEAVPVVAPQVSAIAKDRSLLRPLNSNRFISNMPSKRLKLQVLLDKLMKWTELLWHSRLDAISLRLMLMGRNARLVFDLTHRN